MSTNTALSAALISHTRMCTCVPPTHFHVMFAEKILIRTPWHYAHTQHYANTAKVTWVLHPGM